MDIKFKEGDIRNGHPVIKSTERKKLLLMGDDLRMSSGISTMSKEFVFGTVHRYDWVQLAAAVDHPEKGREIDIGEDIRKLTGVEGASVKIIPWSGYGNADVLRQIVMRHNPDGIVFFTDPRYWRYLFDIEHEVRQSVPMIYYNIWDNTGGNNTDPLYNSSYYASCDALLGISRQTYGINHRVIKKEFGDEFEIKGN